MCSLVSFREVIKSYRALFFDAYGVLVTEHGLFPGVGQTLNILAKERPFFIISNDASKSPENIADKYLDKQFGRIVEESQIITSGMITSDYLKKNHPNKNVAYLGPTSSEYYFSASGNPFLPLWKVKDPSWIEVFVLMDNEGFSWESSLNILLNTLRKNPSMVLLAPNPDLCYPCSEGTIALASGALVKMMEAVLKRDFIQFGKPNRAIFEFAFQQAQKKLPDLALKEILMVGDNLATDIKGARDFGLDSLLVFSGNTPKENCHELIQEEGTGPTYFAMDITS